MHRIDGYGATATNTFTEGDPAQATPIPATDVTADWLNDMQENACGLIEAAGIALVKGDYTQLYKAILKVTGKSSTSMRTIIASGTVQSTDQRILIDASSGNINLTFLSAASADAKAIKVKRIDASANQVSLLPDGIETVDGESSIELSMQGESYEFVPDGVDNYEKF